jgi:putative transposase
MPYDPDRHHRRSIRLRGYDYAQAGAYFLTIVCQHRECLIDPAPARAMVQAWWDRLAEKFSMVESDAFVIMPNHIHGIIRVADPVEADLVGANPRVRPVTGQEEGQTHGQTHGSAPTADRPVLGRMVQWFKTMTTNAYIRGVRQDGWQPFPGRLWQRNYYERVIRNERELNAIRDYIVRNPAHWEEDSEYPDAAPRIAQRGQIP